MKNINLLTEKYTGRIALRRNARKITVIITVIFLFWLIIVIGLALINGILQNTLTENAIALADEKYSESDRLAKALQAKESESNEMEKLQGLVRSNMSLYYWAALTEEIGNIEAKSIEMDNMEKKIKVTAWADTKEDIAQLVERLKRLDIFIKIDLAEMSGDNEQMFFVLELHTGAE